MLPVDTGVVHWCVGSTCPEWRATRLGAANPARVADRARLGGEYGEPFQTVGCRVPSCGTAANAKNRRNVRKRCGGLRSAWRWPARTGIEVASKLNSVCRTLSALRVYEHSAEGLAIGWNGLRMKRRRSSGSIVVETINAPGSSCGTGDRMAEWGYDTRPSLSINRQRLPAPAIENENFRD
jgi:hypothetical protein